MTPTTQLTNGVFHGGCAQIFTQSLNLHGEEILYLGDHIYGDIVRLKRACSWRTGLVIEELTHEIRSLERARPIWNKVQDLKRQKYPLEQEVMAIKMHQKEQKHNIEQTAHLHKQIQKLDDEIAHHMSAYQSVFNPYWGEVMRVGNEESYFADQAARYACIYMPTLVDFFSLSPYAYLEGTHRPLPHEYHSL